MERKHGIMLAVGLVTVIGALIWWGFREGATAEALDTSVTTYFYGEECPHCQNVRKFLDENNVAEKYSFVKREVWHDRANAALMREAANVCGVKPEGMAVPFVFADGQCTIGEPQVIDFFKQKAGI